MKPTDIGLAYDQITERWSDELFNRNNGIAQHERAIAFSEKRGKALDIGCGCTGRFIQLLQEKGFQPSGIDVSTKMIQLARQRHPDVRFIHADICEYALPEKYDFITAWDSLWHVPLAQQSHVLRKVVASLNNAGLFIFSFGGTKEPDAHTNQIMGPEVYYASLGINGIIKLMMDLGCIIRHVEYDQYPEMHTYMIVEKP
ncbi:class I SAM-dependent DNA methyltransferase [Vibrio rarus]|uniref:class I SAM-dependent DNA methyltransferase n=1 Tax=Vibrio rarus TaxID=413403 RepID=UPI0021C4BB54|nr:class I SAM-dependent methyltransferase [Vibrio rarus]